MVGKIQQWNTKVFPGSIPLPRFMRNRFENAQEFRWPREVQSNLETSGFNAIYRACELLILGPVNPLTETDLEIHSQLQYNGFPHFGLVI